MTKLKTALLGVLAMSCIAPAAQAGDSAWGPFTAGVSLTSDYRFRGISQSDRDPALQGWVQYDHASGAFANVWASSVDFNDSTAHDAGVEIDLTAGYNFKLGENTSATAKAVYYWYADADTPPAGNDYDYWEFIAGVSHDYGKIGVSAELAYSPDFFEESDAAVALTGGVSAPLMEKFLFFTGGLEASAHLGYQWYDDNSGATGTGLPDYLFYDLGFGTSWNQISLDVRWVDTDVNKTQCGSDWCEGGVVVSVSASLP